MASRRQFMQVTCRTLAALGAGSRFGRFGLMNAMSQNVADYKALVCIALYGGNDANNLIVPISTANYAKYTKNRGNLALGGGSLLPIPATQDSFAVHSKLAGLQGLYTGGKAAILANVGPLVTKTSRVQYQQRQVALPFDLYSHSSQSGQWLTDITNGSADTGWAGRTADLMHTQNASTFPLVTSVSGNNPFGLGKQTRPAIVNLNGTLGLQGFGNNSGEVARLGAVQNVLKFDTGLSLVQSAKSRLSQGINDSTTLSLAVKGATPLTTKFPATGLGNQLSQIARIIQVRAELGMSRQIFIAGIGGFDTHSAQLPQQDALFTQINDAVLAFYNATLEMTVDQQVTAFTVSDFSRTLQANSNDGTDHAWGSHQMIVGGAVKGKEVYGTFPTLDLNGPDDSSGQGRWIPTTSLDQYGATLAEWFGVNTVDLPTVFPNLNNFATKKLGFL